MIGLARAGDVAAYETLVRRYQDVALRTAYLVAPEADAADAVQDGFLKAYAALSRFHDGAPIRPWLLRIVANEARNQRRSANRRAGLALRAALVAPRDETVASTESEVLAREARSQLHAALGQLRDEEREVIGARYLLGLSEAETAETLSIPAVGSCRSMRGPGDCSARSRAMGSIGWSPSSPGSGVRSATWCKRRPGPVPRG